MNGTEQTPARVATHRQCPQGTKRASSQDSSSKSRRPRPRSPGTHQAPDAVRGMRLTPASLDRVVTSEPNTLLSEVPFLLMRKLH